MSDKKHPRSEGKFNFSVINEVRSVICVETFLMISQQSMTVPKQRDTCFKLFHGENEIMGQAEKFMKRLSIYSDLWAMEQGKLGPRYFIPERLHQQYGKSLVAGDNITESLIRRLYEKNHDDMLSGQAIVAKAKEAVKEAKKMHGLMSVAVKEGVLQKEMGEFIFPSGRSEDDFDQWMLKRMYNWDKYYGASGMLGTGMKEVKNNVNEETGGGDNNVDVNENEDLPLPRNVFAEDIELNTSSIADDKSVSDTDEPPPNFLPKGWVIFKTRGPMSMPIENRLDFFSESLADSKRNVKHGRDHFRKEAAKDKAASRDYTFDDTSLSVSSRDARGVGVVNRKFAVRTAQRDAQLSLQQMETDLLKVNSVLKSKHTQRDSHLEMAKLYIQMDDKEEARKEMQAAKATMGEISELEARAMEIQTTLPASAGDGNIDSNMSKINESGVNANEEE